MAELSEEYRKKLLPAELNWIVLNNLQLFNDKPMLIEELYFKISKLTEHPILSNFIEIYREVYSVYYNRHNSFPDIAWLDANFRGKNLKITDNVFSMTLYEDLVKIIDGEILMQDIKKGILEKDSFSIDDIRGVTSKMVKYTESNNEIPAITKDTILNMYDNYKINYKGVKTHISVLDELIGSLGYKSISVFGAISGHGKSTFALSVTYNAAIYGGLCIDYISYELDKEQMWFNLGSIESNVENINIESSRIKEAILTKDEEDALRTCKESMLNKLNVSGGFINVIDQSALQINTFEGLVAKLESIAEERGRKADLIVVDNVDNLRILKSSERDESTKVNKFITELDSLSKKYYNGEGTHILLLSQVNRVAMKKLDDVATKSEESKSKIDVTCFQQYNALYEKATCALVGFADAKMRSIDRMNIYPVKLRNRPVPIEPIQIPAKFAYSRVGGDVEIQDTSESTLDRYFNENVDDMVDDITG